MESFINNGLKNEQNTIIAITEGYKSLIIFKRWAATVIDVIILCILIISPFSIRELFEESFYKMIYNVWLCSVLIVALGYYLILEAFSGYTIGKFIFRIKVVNEVGSPPGFKKNLIRTFFRLFELNPLLIGGIIAGIVALTSKYKQRLGDMVAKTYVINSRDFSSICQYRIKKYISIIFVVVTLIILAFGAFGSAEFLISAIENAEKIKY